MPFRKRGWDDVIPAKGEARVLAELKGSYGSKGRSMRSYRKGGRRFSRRYNSSNPAAEWQEMILGNANWEMYKPNMWKPLNGSTAATTAVRILSINADTVAALEQNPDCTLKRIDIEMAWMAMLGMRRANGTLGEYDSGTRDDIPPFGTSDPTTGFSGPLLSGDVRSNTLVGGTSWAEGLPFQLALIYETEQEANGSLEAVLEEPWVVQNQRTKRFFWQKLYCPTIYRPAMVTIDKTFPGRGVALRKGQREIYQVSLIAWAYSDMGTTVEPGWTFAVGKARALYFEAATA